MEKGKNILKAAAVSAILMTIGIEGNTCTNVIVSRGASKDGSVLV